MRVVVCGLGHIGSVTAACLLRDGHTIIAVDIDEHKRGCFSRGASPVREAGVGELIAEGHAKGRLCVTDSRDGLSDADIAIICVGTPTSADGAVDLSQVRAAAATLGEAARLRSTQLAPMLIVFRSTMLPGSMREVVLPGIRAAAGEPPGTRYEVAYNPEFLRLGSAIADYSAPARIIIGEREPGIAQALRTLYSGIDAPVFSTTFELAELAKYADNAFHALKVAFANEVGRIALHSGVAPADLAELFLADNKLNLSSRYLRPGGAFGGPCLPKDVRALAEHARNAGVAAPVIGHILHSNARHADFLVREIERRAGARARVLLIGLSFKKGTDELRGSPFVGLAEALVDRGHELAIYDPDIKANSSLAHLPARLSGIVLPELPDARAFDLVVAGKTDPETLKALGASSTIFAIDGL